MTVRPHWVFAAWLASGLFVIVAMGSGSGALMAAGGLLLIGWGVVVAGNVRGAADAMPKRFGIGPIWQEQSRSSIRLTFAFFAFVGLLLLYGGLAQLL